MSLKPLVIDISSYQPVVDFAKVAASGIVGVIAKATEGGGWNDRTYAAHRKAALAAGLLFGAYHFFNSSTTAVAQARHFLSVAEPDKQTLLCLDWENPPHQMTPGADAALAFMAEIESETGQAPLLYGGNVPKEMVRGVDPRFAKYRLWLAQYGLHFTTQATWKNQPWLWQFSEHYEVPGVGDGDVSCIVGDMTVERLKAEWAL